LNASAPAPDGRHAHHPTASAVGVSEQHDGTEERLAKYACPTHADVTAPQPGSCSICGMKLKEILPRPPPTREDSHEQ
jgi:hypothetical protein